MSVYYFSGKKKRGETPAERRKRENAEQAAQIQAKRIAESRRGIPEFWEMVDSDEFRAWWEDEVCGDYSIFSSHPDPEILPLIVEAAREDLRKAKEDKILASMYLDNNDISYQERRRIRQALATPSWANHVEIKKIYAECRKMNIEYGYTKYHVDHVIPIQGRYVTGLHVHDNMQILDAIENLKKGNDYFP